MRKEDKGGLKSQSHVARDPAPATREASPSAAFGHARGSITHRGDPITDEDAHWYRALYRDELFAAFAAQDDGLYEAARSLHMEIVNAQEEQRQFRKANPAQAQWVRCMNVRRAA